MKIIELTQNQIALVDDEDYERVNQFKWYANFDPVLNSFYAKRTDYSNGQKTVLMHRYIMNVTNSKIQVDHKNHDTLNNMKENLRPCTHIQNGMNRKLQIHSSKYKGISWDKVGQKWRAQIKLNYKTIYLGLFDNEYEAYQARLQAENQYHGKFAYLSHLP